jgi:nickel-dependent lactate racemase
VFAGEPEKAHATGVQFLKDTSIEEVPFAADLVITSASGYPLDLTFYQSVKGITAAQHIAKPRGRILVIGECAEGIGSSEFANKLQAYAGHQNYLDEIRDSKVETDQWQLEKLALVGLKHELFFFTPGVSKEQIGFLGDHLYSDLAAAIDAATTGLPAHARIAVITEGPYVYARVKQNNRSS